MVISTALLGMSAGATWVALRAGRGKSFGRPALANCAIVFAVWTPIVLFALTRGGKDVQGG